MNTEYTLWGTRKGNADWQEEVITSTSDKARLEKARAWAVSNGFDRLRVSTFGGNDATEVQRLLTSSVHKSKR